MVRLCRLLSVSTMLGLACSGGEAAFTDGASGLGDGGSTTLKVVSVEYMSLWPKVGGESTDYFPTCLAHLLGTTINGAPNPLARVKLTNFSPAPLEAAVQVNLPGYAAVGEQTVSLASTETKDVDVTPKFDFTKLFALTTRVPGSVEVRVRHGGTVIFQETHPVQLLGRNELWLDKKFPFSAAFVTPNDKGGAVASLLTAAAQESAWKKMDGYQVLGQQVSQGYNVPQGNFLGSFTYLEAGGALQITLAQVSGPVGGRLDFYVLDQTSYAAYKGGAQVEFKSRHNDVKTGSTISFTAPAAGLYYYLFENMPTAATGAITVSLTRAANTWDVVWDQAQALFNALKKKPMSYVNAPGGTAWWNLVQIVRYPADSLADKAFTCIDGAILLASAFERLGMSPLLYFLPGHALVGVRIAQNHPWIIRIEQNMIPTDTFFAAATKADEELAGQEPEVIDIAAIRAQGVTPAPM